MWKEKKTREKLVKVVCTAALRTWVVSMLLVVFATTNYNLDTAMELFAYRTHDSRIASSQLLDY